MTTRARQWLIVLGTVVLVTAAYAVAGFVGVPHLLRSQLISFVQEKYGRTASIGEIRFNPFTFALEAKDFTLPDADGKPMLAFGRLWVDLDVATLWRFAPSFSDIELERPFIRTLVRKNGPLNLTDLAKPFETPGSPPPPPEEKPARLFIDRFSVNAGNVTFEDDSRASPFKAQLEPITFELRDFSTTAHTGNAYALIGASTRGEKFVWNGSLSVAPLASQGRFEVTDLHARTVWSYLRDSLGFEFSGGHINLNGDYRFAVSPAVALNVNVHRVSVADLGIRPAGQEMEYIQHANAQVDNTRFDLGAERVDVGKLQLTGGTVHAWRDDKGGINLTQLMASPAAKAGDAAPAAPAAEATATPTTTTAASTAAPTDAATTASAPSAPVAAPPVTTTAPASAASSASTPPSRWVIAAPDIAIENLRLELEDRLLKPHASFTLAPINVNVRGYSSASTAPLDLDANLHINESARLQAKGQLSPDSGALSAHVDLEGFDLESIQPYINAYTQITLQSGILKSGLDIERGANGNLDIKGDTEVSKLRTVDNLLRQDLVKWDHLRLEGLHYRSEPESLNIARLIARAPYARLIIAPDQSLNVVDAMTPTPGTSPPAVQTVRAAPDEKPRAPGGNPGGMKIDIGEVRITDGSANFADFWIQPNYAVSLQSLDGTITGLSSNPKSRAKVALAGKVDRYAPAQIGGEMNLLSAALFTDMKVSFQGVDMSSVTPYSGRFAGYKIEKGKLSINVEYHVEDRKLDAKQRFVVDQLQLGEKVDSPEAVHLPLKIAVALLKDRNGVIDLDLPVSGSLDDPQFRIGPIIWKAFVNLLTKIVTAPFALLGSLFGGSPEMNLIDFQPGAATLDGTAQERTASVVKALKERPQIQLDIPAPYSPEADGSVLATQKLDAKLQLLAQKQGKRDTSPEALQTLLADPSQRFDLLLAQYRLDHGADAEPPAAAAAVLKTSKKKVDPAALSAANEELEAAIKAKQPIAERDLEELAQARARAIQDAVLASGEIDHTRIFLLAAASAAPTDGKVRVTLAVK